MRILIFILLPVLLSGQSLIDLQLQAEQQGGVSLGPELITNGTFDTDTDWTKNGGSTISGGLGNLTASGPIGVTGTNWSFWQTVFTAGLDYRVSFDARQVSGSGNLEVGNDFADNFNQAVTGTMQTYTFDIISVGATRITFGGTTPGNTFEIDNVSVKQILP